MQLEVYKTWGNFNGARLYYKCRARAVPDSHAGFMVLVCRCFEDEACVLRSLWKWWWEWVNFDIYTTESRIASLKTRILRRSILVK